MAVCAGCRQEMIDRVPCTVTVYDDFVDGIVRERKPYPVDPEYPPDCGDCGTLQGHPHHPGCAVERCPRCGGQCISCNCEGTDDEECP